MGERTVVGFEGEGQKPDRVSAECGENITRKHLASLPCTGDAEAVVTGAAGEDVDCWIPDALKNVRECSAIAEGEDTGDGLMSATQSVVNEASITCPAGVAEGLSERGSLFEFAAGEGFRRSRVCFRRFK